MNKMNGVGLMHLFQFVGRAVQWLGCDIKSSGEATSSGRAMLALLKDS